MLKIDTVGYKNREHWADFLGKITADPLAIAAIVLLYSHLLPFFASHDVSMVPFFFILWLGGGVYAFGIARGRRLSSYQWGIVIALMVYFVELLIQIALAGDLDGHDELSSTYRERIAYLLTTIAMIAIFRNISKPKIVINVFRGVVIFSVIVVVVEFFRPAALPVKMTEDAGRAAGLFQNPNITGIFLSSSVPLACLNFNLFRRMVVYAITFTGVYLTFSRGGLLMWATTVFLVEFFDSRSPRQFTQKKLIQLAMFVGIGLFIVLAKDTLVHFVVVLLHGKLDRNTSERIAFATNESTISRQYVVQLAYQEFLKSPIFGRGIGYGNIWSFDVSVHNMFALIMLEQGVIGLTWMAFFVWRLFSGPYPFGIWNGLLFCMASMFDHNLFDSPTYGMIIVMYCTLPFLLVRQTGEAAATPRPVGPPQLTLAASRLKPQVARHG